MVTSKRTETERPGYLPVDQIAHMIELSEHDILLRLTTTEDSTVERKTAHDYRDCLKTAVAFSNSQPVDDPGIIFVGVGNDGTVQDNPNLDSMQGKVSDELSKVYPPIYPQMKVMRKDGREFLAVIVRGSMNRPHFAGPSYIRDGSRTIVASKDQFEQLIAERNRKVRYILRWKGREITYRYLEPALTSLKPGILTDCTEHFVVVDKTRVVPLECTLIGHDATNDRLRLDFMYAGS